MKIRAAVEDLVMDSGPGRTARLHASFGVASTADHGSDRIPLLRSADSGLYRAKQLGRNRVETAAV
jgi:diguanylate cyclase (GGDEF)-like protein